MVNVGARYFFAVAPVGAKILFLFLPWSRGGGCWRLEGIVWSVMQSCTFR